MAERMFQAGVRDATYSGPMIYPLLDGAGDATGYFVSGEAGP